MTDSVATYCVHATEGVHSADITNILPKTYTID